MTRYFIHFSYLGTAFHGWQIQPNAVTVQAVMEEALSRLLRQKICVWGCGRTDAGVHARMFYAHFELDRLFSESEALDFVHKLNAYLSNDIMVFELRPVFKDVHARFSAISRTYQYKIITHKDPFLTGQAWYYHYGKLELSRMNDAASILLDYSDFACFSKKDTDILGTHCRMLASSWQQDDHLFIFTVTANRFLRNMVRAIVGTLVEIGRGRWDNNDLKNIFASGDRCKAGESVPACGLYLTDVKYPEGIYQDW